MTQLDAACEAWLARVVAARPPLTEAQRDLIAAVFRGELQPASDRDGAA